MRLEVCPVNVRQATAGPARDAYDSRMPGEDSEISYLRRSRLFERTSDDVIGTSEHLFELGTFGKGAVVYKPGDGDRHLYLIETGRVLVSHSAGSGKELTVALLGPGDLFGEEVTFTDAARMTRVTCLEATVL